MRSDFDKAKELYNESKIMIPETKIRRVEGATDRNTTVDQVSHIRFKTSFGASRAAYDKVYLP